MNLTVESALWFYAGGMVATLIQQFLARSTVGLGPPRPVRHWFDSPVALRAGLYAKGLAWALIWPAFFVVQIIRKAQYGTASY